MKSAPAATIDAYIAGFPRDVQDILQQVRAIIRQTVPDAGEKISYGIPTFTLHGRNLVHFAAFKHHIGFYPTPAGQETFREALSVYKTGKGSVQFPIDQPMPLHLITRIVQFRVKEVTAKNKKK